MKLKTILSLTIAAGSLLALAAPVQAQGRHHGGGSGGRPGGMPGGGRPGGMNGGGRPGGIHGGGFVNRGNWNRGDWNRGHFGHHHFGGGHVNFFFGGFGYPYYGYPYFYGYPYYGYPYYAYAVPTYTYDPQGVYQGRVVRPERNRTESDAKDVSLEARVQEELAQSGYYRGAIDGIVGDETRRAIRSYERANRLHVDGRIDSELLATMGLG